jgi:hypothetical protein
MEVRNTRLVQQTTTAAMAQPELAGIPFDPISLIISLVAPFLSGLFTNCQNPTPTPTPTKLTPTQVKLRLQKEYYNGQYSLAVQMPVVTHTMQVARQTSQGRIKRKQARVIAIATLDAARTADDDTLGECLMACQAPAAALLGDHSEEQ